MYFALFPPFLSLVLKNTKIYSKKHEGTLLGMRYPARVTPFTFVARVMPG